MQGRIYSVSRVAPAGSGNVCGRHGLAVKLDAPARDARLRQVDRSARPASTRELYRGYSTVLESSNTVDSLAGDSARGHGRVLCVRRGTGSSGTERQAADRRRHRRARRGRRGQLRGAALRRPLGDADARGPAALSAGDLRAAAHGALPAKFRLKCSRSSASSRRWWKGFPWTRRFSMSPRASGCSAARRPSAPKSGAGSAPPLNLPPRSESHPTSCSPRSPRISASPTDCAASDPRTCTRCWTACRFKSCFGVGTKIPAGRASGGYPHLRRFAQGRATRCCGAPSASMANRCKRWHRESTSGPVDAGSRGEIDQRGGDLRHRHSRRCGARRQLTAPRRSHRRALAGSRSRRRLGSRSRSGARISRRYTRQRALEPPTQDTAAICAAAQRLLLDWLRTPARCRSAIAGRRASAICSRSRQADLFYAAAAQGVAARRGHRRHSGPLRVRRADPGEPAPAPARRHRSAPRLRLVSSRPAMYLSFFGLSEKPFAITPDPRYLYLSERHAEALAHLLYGINEVGRLHPVDRRGRHRQDHRRAHAAVARAAPCRRRADPESADHAGRVPAHHLRGAGPRGGRGRPRQRQGDGRRPEPPPAVGARRRQARRRDRR